MAWLLQITLYSIYIKVNETRSLYIIACRSQSNPRKICLFQSDGNFLAANRCLGTFAVAGICIFRIDCSIGSRIILFGGGRNAALAAVSLLMLSTESFREFFVGEPWSDTDFVVLFDGLLPSPL